MPNNHIIFIDPHDSQYFELCSGRPSKSNISIYSIFNASCLTHLPDSVCGDQRSDEQETVWGKVAVQCIPTVPLEKVRSAHKMCVGSQVCIKSHQFLFTTFVVWAMCWLMYTNCQRLSCPLLWLAELAHMSSSWPITGSGQLRRRESVRRRSNTKYCVSLITSSLISVILNAGKQNASDILWSF